MLATVRATPLVPVPKGEAWPEREAPEPDSRRAQYAAGRRPSALWRSRARCRPRPRLLYDVPRTKLILVLDRAGQRGHVDTVALQGLDQAIAAWTFDERFVDPQVR